MATGFIQTIKNSITGNDGCISSDRIIRYLWNITTMVLVMICVLRRIKIDSGVLLLLGGAIGASTTSGIINKKTEVSASSKEKKDE
jgi:hypothetical protein